MVRWLTPDCIQSGVPPEYKNSVKKSNLFECGEVLKKQFIMWQFLMESLQQESIFF